MGDGDDDAGRAEDGEGGEDGAGRAKDGEGGEAMVKKRPGNGVLCAEGKPSTSGASPPGKAVAVNVSSWTRNDHVEVMWKGEWWQGTLQDVGETRVRVHYVGGSSSDEEWIRKDSERLRAPADVVLLKV